MHFDFFALSIYFFVHPLCGRVAHFGRFIVIIICTFSDFFLSVNFSFYVNYLYFRLHFVVLCKVYTNCIIL